MLQCTFILLHAFYPLPTTHPPNYSPNVRPNPPHGPPLTPLHAPNELQFIQCMLHDTTALEHSNSNTQKCDNKKSEIWPLEGVNFSRFPDEKIPGNGK